MAAACGCVRATWRLKRCIPTTYRLSRGDGSKAVQTLIHVVDLNGAVDGEPRNLPQIEAIIRTVSLNVQVGGGIRSIETVRRYLGAGVTQGCARHCGIDRSIIP